MYVLVDMEWISNQRGNHWPTQLAATRVDAQWNTVDIFSALFRPKGFSFQQWGHMAFSGWNREQFLNGESLYAGLDAFRLWLVGICFSRVPSRCIIACLVIHKSPLFHGSRYR